MNNNNFTHSFSHVLNDTVSIASQNNHGTIQTIHFLSAALNNDFCMSACDSLNINTEELKQLIKLEFEKIPKISNGQPAIDQTLQTFLSECRNESKHLGDDFISLDVALLVLSKTKSFIENILFFFNKNDFNYK